MCDYQDIHFLLIDVYRAGASSYPAWTLSGWQQKQAAPLVLVWVHSDCYCWILLDNHECKPCIRLAPGIVWPHYRICRYDLAQCLNNLSNQSAVRLSNLHYIHSLYFICYECFNPMFECITSVVLVNIESWLILLHYLSSHLDLARWHIFPEDYTAFWDIIVLLELESVHASI